LKPDGLHVMLVIHGLSGGGAERVCCHMADAWVARGWRVTILTLDDTAPPFYPLDSRVELTPLARPIGKASALTLLRHHLDLVRLIRRAIVRARPDVVISFIDQTNVEVILATRGLKLPVLVYEANDPDRGLRAAARNWKMWERLRHWTYPHADRVVLLAEDFRGYFRPNVRQRCVVLANPVLPPEDAPATSGGPAPARQPVVLAAGSLSYQKQFDHLLRAFAIVAPRHPDWSLDLYGKGPERDRLVALIDELGLTGRVRLPGHIRTLGEAMRRAGLFAMSSRYEGFPMVLGMAMAHGLPAVSYDCPGTPGEVIRDGVDGQLVPPDDIAALAAAMDRLIADPELRGRLAARAPEVIERFSVDRVMDDWERLIRDARQPAGPRN
jgi:GalNAc-alpha-(1->4)-GalNAc-alpha-(1->3)-diNAcBac-PP-undecaprenol alpha-1,4-N-acetyl-D-galactosaminyltransferase